MIDKIPVFAYCPRLIRTAYMGLKIEKESDGLAKSRLGTTSLEDDCFGVLLRAPDYHL